MSTHRSKQSAIVTLLVGLLAAGVVVAHSAQQSSRASSPDEIVAELRALRADVRETGAATIRAQLLVGRLQLQEGRINNVAWQLAEVRRLLADHEAKKAKPLASLKRAEDGIAKGVTGFDLAIATARAELARIEQEEQPLRAQEAQLARQLNAEQQRWTEFNSQLDQLERTLAKSERQP